VREKKCICTLLHHKYLPLISDFSSVRDIKNKVNMAAASLDISKIDDIR